MNTFRSVAAVLLGIAMVMGVLPGQQPIAAAIDDDRAASADVQAADTVPVDQTPKSRSGITPLVPARLVDTRPDQTTIDGEQNGDGRLGADSTFVVDVAGRGGVPDQRVSAVMLNVTVVTPSSPGFATVFPASAARPLAANLNHGTSTATANQVLVKLDEKGRVAIYHVAEAHLVVDVVGWIDEDGDAPTLVPARLLDTRSTAETIDGRLEGIGRLGDDRSVSVSVLGRGGVPADGAGSVMVSVTAVKPSATGFITVYPDGVDRPNAASLNYTPGSVVANQVVTSLGDNGRFTIYTSSATDIVVDVVGWLPDDSDVATFAPGRILDTRQDGNTVDGLQAGGGDLIGGSVLDVQVGGRAGVEGDAGAVILNVTAVQPSATGFLTVYPLQDELPTASSLNFATGQNVANQVLVQLGDDAKIRVYSPVDTDVVIDVAAWLPPGVNQINPDVVTLTENGARVELASGGNGTGAATFEMPTGEDLEVDDIVVLEDTTGLPFYGRVDAVTGEMVSAKEVTLGEVIPSGSYDFVADAATGILEEDSFGAEQTSRQINQAALDSIDSIGITAGNTTVDCAGTKVGLDFDFDGLSFEGSADWGAFYITAEAFYTPRITVKGTVDLPDGGSCTVSRTVLTKDLPTIRFSIGPVPVVIRHQLSLEVEVEITAEGPLKMTAGATASAKIGARYRNGLSIIKEFDVDRIFTPPTKEKATFEVALVASYSASVYGVLGFKAWIRPSVRTVIDPSVAKWIVATAQVEVGLSAEIGFSIDLFIGSVGFNASQEIDRGLIWGPREIYSRNRNNTLTMSSSMPKEAVENQAVTGQYSLGGVPGGSTVTWTSTGLPAGFTLKPNGTNSATATVTGTPSSTAPISFKVDADVLPPGKWASNMYGDATSTLAVVPAFSAGPQALGIGEVDRQFEGTIVAKGGKAPYTWSATGLPAGVTLAATTTTSPINALVGTTPTASTGRVQVTIKDSSSARDVSTGVDWTVYPAINIPAVAFSPGDVGQFYSKSFTVADGTDAITHTASGIPYGLNVILSGRTVTVAGTPLVSGPQAYRVDVRSRLGNTASTTRYFPIRPPLVLDTSIVTIPVGSAEAQPADGWISVVGGKAPYSWTVTGLPDGVTFDSSQNGRRVRVMGALPTAIVRNVDIEVTDSIGSTPAIGSVALRAVEGASFSTTVVPTGALRGVYSGTIDVAGGRAPYDLKAVGLPVGVTVARSGDSRFVLSGTPTLAGSYQVRFELSDSSGRPSVRQVTPISIEPALALVDGTLPNAVTGTAYAAGTTLSVTGGVAPYSWTVTGLPDGMELSGDPAGAIRTLTGTPVEAGDATVSISVTDSAGSSAVTDTRSFTVTAPLTISTTGAPTTAYTDLDVAGTITSTGGNLPVSFTATNLPTGMALSTAGVISGRPESGDSTVTVTYTATDALGYTAADSVDLRVIPGLALDLTSVRTALATGRLYDGSVSATGGVPPYTYTIEMQNSSDLPGFIELGAPTGQFTSTNVATAAASYGLRITVTDSDGDGRSKSADYTLEVAETEPITITLTAPSVGTNGTSITGTSSATGGIAPYTWSLVDSPTWLTIDESTGALSGVPIGENGSVNVTVKAVGGIFEKTKTIAIDIRPPVTVDLSSVPATGSAGVAYSGSFSWAGGRTPTVTVTGLPSTLTASTSATSPRTITGRPLTGATYTVSVTATDPDGRTATATKTVTIAAAAALAMDVSTMPTAPELTTSGTEYAGTATVSGGVTAYTWTQTGLPAGVTMTTSGDTATFAGRPSSSGTYPVELKVTDEAGSTVTKTVTLDILLEPLSISITELWSIGHNGLTEALGTVRGAGGRAPYTFSAAGLPTGLAIDADTGVISGTATTVAAATDVTITVTDSKAKTITATWSIEIKEPVVITKPYVPTELSASAFIPIKLPSVAGTPTFSTNAIYSGGSSTSMFSCKLYVADQWGCYGDPTQAAITLDIFVTVGDSHGALRVPMAFTNQRIRDISIGRDHGCAVYADTTMKCWGGNGQGQLGNAFVGQTAPTFSLEPVYVTDSDGTRTTGWSNVETSANAESGKEFTCALKKEQTTTSPSPGIYDETQWARSTWCWGYGLDGQLGNGSSTSSTTPVRVHEEGLAGLYRYDALDLVVGGTTACAQRIDGINVDNGNRATGPTGSSVLTSVCWGKSIGNLAKSYGTFYNAVDWLQDRFSDHLAIGRDHSCLTYNFALYTDARVSCDGASAVTGGTGFVDAGPQQDLYWPKKIAAGRAHTCALLGSILDTSTSPNVKTDAAGEIRCWGDNSSNQLGSTSTATNVIQATGGPSGLYYWVSANDPWQMLAGGDTTCANTKSTDTVGVLTKCWGTHYAGSTPGALATITVPENAYLKTVGATAACAKPSSGNAYWCWGSNTNGQMGLGSNSLNGGTTVAYPSNV